MSLFKQKKLTSKFLVLGDKKQFSKREKNAAALLRERVKEFFDDYQLWVNHIDSCSDNLDGFRTLAKICDRIWARCYPKDGLFIGPMPGDKWYYSDSDDATIKKRDCKFCCFPKEEAWYSGSYTKITPHICIDPGTGNSDQIKTVSQWLESPQIEGNLVSKLVENYKKQLKLDLRNIHAFVLKLDAQLEVHGF